MMIWCFVQKFKVENVRQICNFLFQFRYEEIYIKNHLYFTSFFLEFSLYIFHSSKKSFENQAHIIILINQDNSCTYLNIIKTIVCICVTSEILCQRDGLKSRKLNVFYKSDKILMINTMDFVFVNENYVNNGH